MYSVSSLLRIFLAKICFLEFLYGILLLSRCCFHHLVENSILYKKRYTALLHRTNTFSKIKITWSVVGEKVDGQILFGTRSEKQKIYLAPGMRNGKIYLAPNDSFEQKILAVKGLNWQVNSVGYMLYSCNKL